MEDEVQSSRIRTSCVRIWRVRIWRVCARGGAVAFAASVLSVFVLSGSAGAADPDISGTYWATRYSARIEIVGGGELPLTTAGKAAYDANVAGLKDGSLADDARKFCLPDGLPRVLATPYPFEIIHGPPGQITISYELNHQFRLIAMNKPMPSDRDLAILPFYNGHAYGHFEGDALVVETAGFNEKTFLDATGAPHTDALRTFERIRKIGPAELEDVITIHDPEYYTQDWQARFVYHQHSDVRLEDYVCGEPHRDISAVAGVRRR
jgi:hypothetical protein